MAGNSNLVANTISNDSQNLLAQCKVVVYNWASNLLSSGQSDGNLASSTALDVSSQVMNVQFSKTMGGPTGSFSFTLSNSPEYGSGDWKDIIKRGSWCIIYMTQDGNLLTTPKVGPPNSKANKAQEAKLVRCIGFIDRVSVRSQIDEKGAFDVMYEVSGRDFGVVYEDTTIWHNLFHFDQIMLQALTNTQLNVVGTVKLNVALSLVHDLFFNPKAVPGAVVNKNSSLLSIALQWLLPSGMMQDLLIPVDDSPYWGELDMKRGSSTGSGFAPTEANLSISSPLDFLSGAAWEQLKKISSPQFHELFTETDDSGKPTLTFRPIPFAIDKSKYPTVGGNIMYYKDLPTVTVPALDVIDFSVGEDNHNRYNSFLTTVQTTLLGVESNVSVVEPAGFPKFTQDSIKRYGFRPMHVTVDSIVKNAEKSDGRSDQKTLIEYNWVLYDYWNNAVFSESGELNAIGRNTIKVGKCINFDEKTPYVYGKRYYIEGYTDQFAVDEKGVGTWVQTVMLTRGFEEQDLLSQSGFGTRNTKFQNQGEFTPAGSPTNGSTDK